MTLKDLLSCIPQHRFAILSLFLATVFMGCTSKILKPESLKIAPRVQTMRSQELPEVAYTVYARSPRLKQDLEKVFREVCASQGLNTRDAEVSPGRPGIHVALYELEGERLNTAVILLEMATLFLMPYCQESIYSIELHVLGSMDGNSKRPRVIRDEYVIDECTWMPTLAKDSREHEQLRNSALRLVLTETVRKALVEP